MMGGDGRVEAAVVVVMVAFPAQSHMNQLLQLSYLLSSYNIPVHYAGSALHNHLLRHRAPTSFDHHYHEKQEIQFHDFPLPPFSAPDPDPSAHHFPAHLYPSFNATMHLREPVFNLCTQLASGVRRLVIIFDSLMGYVVQDAAAALVNAEAYVFRAISSFTAFSSDWESKGKPIQEEMQLPDELPTMEDCFTIDVMEFLAFQVQFLKSRSGDLRNTSRVIEGTYLDLQDRIGDGKKQWAIGPLHVHGTNQNQHQHQHQHYCMKWLDEQPPKSVILVAFGSLTPLSEEQIVEIGRGLEESKARFLWVLRDADRGDASVTTASAAGAVLQGFEERVGPMGMVVTDWAPQIQILAHPSTGGFMTHCGWNSCLESISAGVPVAAWPMHSDQPRNATLMTQVLRVGLLVRDWNSRREIVRASVIKEAVVKLMGSKEGEGLRERAEELGRVVNQGVDEGGVSRIQLESFIAHIKRNENVLK